MGVEIKAVASQLQQGLRLCVLHVELLQSVGATAAAWADSS
ncbi:hypothetical protein L499_A1832 [Bordetella holmesii CDC-H635-BH]|uniref:Uncharacterized protein n=1 Tax=Bordetella holmesii CDC-H585-BH TaxID=1331206 RepID=A0A158M5D6_9BORD|nr:hypothetical protein L503_1807 [Bordetella holmesii CDC-H809-BH]KAK81551.1 hypothetical protein L573_0650 [Bordetella holmesii H620]KAK88454.1 hypothetical protein L496_1790 [Bordetella holmesii CDC-H572-BH]KAK88805.1 hypothetical protein L499_A1832 [Bordetella holmesii CDC-H635-BH]KAK90487.1 hypothetical protein L497_1784 [Bordetella holmesii CDC-H585-BH]KCV04365.1 hypothetical protein L501_1814 [Bordetella holmesii CDC-H719-BH]KCV06624.1 hypothetical protein L498_0660 [Bordetella holmesi